MRRLGLADKFVDQNSSGYPRRQRGRQFIYQRGPQEIALDSCSAGADCGMERA
jgi:hypothetical protein